MFSSVKDKIQDLPDQPGCYIWLGTKQTITESKIGTTLHNDMLVLYVGKAICLKNRVRQYFTSNDYKTTFLMKKVVDIDWIVTNTETEALLLENTLIKKYIPPYNIKLKDNKSYPFLCLTLSEPFPRLILNRKKLSPLDQYFGPFPNTKAAKNTLAFIHKIFPIRKKNIKLPQAKPTKPCINFHIKRCWAPCMGTVNNDEYQKTVTQIQLFLQGNTTTLETNLKKNMMEYSEKMMYEKAARIRDLLSDITTITQKQQTDNLDKNLDIDIIALFTADNKYILDVLDIDSPNNLLQLYQDQNYYFGQIALLKIRDGKLLHKESYALHETSIIEHTDIEEYFIESFLRDYYINMSHIDIPSHIYIAMANPGISYYQSPLKWKKNWEQIITEKYQQPIIIHSDNSSYNEWEASIKMGVMNARLTLQERLLSERLRNQKIGLRQIQKMLGLPSLPEFIECYDISNFQGKQAVASGVTLRNGIPYKQGYRKYRIQMENEPNDPAMILETLTRRFERLNNQFKDEKSIDTSKGSVSVVPNLIVIDGGITQLNAALQARDSMLAKQYHHHIPIVSLAKQREEIYFPLDNGEYKILQMDPNSPGMLILRLARDEAHRFALAYHRKLRNQATFE